MIYCRVHCTNPVVFCAEVALLQTHVHGEWNEQQLLCFDRVTQRRRHERRELLLDTESAVFDEVLGQVVDGDDGNNNCCDGNRYVDSNESPDLIK